jgi:transposase-like protein
MSEEKEIVMPVCPFCKTEMRSVYFRGYYESFPMWECGCEEIPGSEESRGAYA